MDLLKLSVFFNADELSNDITIEIEEHFLLPEYLIHIWLLAHELALTLLQDVCMAACLDRFTELPREPINELSQDNFLKLIRNANLRCNHSELQNIVRNWKESNIVSIYQ